MSWFKDLFIRKDLQAETMVYAGIFWMNDAEVEEHHRLVQALNALVKDSSEDARLRIQEKIRLRKILQKEG